MSFTANNTGGKYNHSMSRNDIGYTYYGALLNSNGKPTIHEIDITGAMDPDDIKSMTKKGIEGFQEIQNIMENLRNNPPTEIGGYKVTSFRDYKMDTVKNMETGEQTTIKFEDLA